MSYFVLYALPTEILSKFILSPHPTPHSSLLCVFGEGKEEEGKEIVEEGWMYLNGSLWEEGSKAPSATQIQ